MASLHFQFQLEQPAVGIHHHGLRILAHIFTVPGFDLHDHRDLQHYTLAAAPVCWIGIRQFSLYKALEHYTSRVCSRLIAAKEKCDFVTSVVWTLAGFLRPAIPSLG